MDLCRRGREWGGQLLGSLAEVRAAFSLIKNVMKNSLRKIGAVKLNQRGRGHSNKM